MFAEIIGEILYVMDKVNRMELFMENFWPEKKNKQGKEITSKELCIGWIHQERKRTAITSFAAPGDAVHTWPEMF